MAILYVGTDLAKNVVAVHGVDEHGKAVLVRPSVPRGLSTKQSPITPPPRDDQALMSQGLDPRRESSIMSRRHHLRWSRLTNGRDFPVPK